ncbi:MAG: HAD family hydrolase [Chloroflexi bacterium]|nr:HAD family hydrolase [Chloroflexota bacterium]MDA1147867.1 HAD family hydrolase [Chloroflexota bacterium]MQC82516.1 HAD family hydrolase [Chloroflexota bacterium]MQC83160.1 HAD family hydrolase [Chloroflexota bacterium]
MSTPPFQVTHIVFDVDGTLVDFESALQAALRAAAEEASGCLGTLVTPTQLHLSRELLSVDPAWSGRTFVEMRDESIRRVLASADEHAPEVVRRITGTYYAARDANLHAYDDVEEALSALAGRGFTLIAATNGNAPLAAHPFMAHVAHHQQAEAIGISKPNQAFFARAIADTGGEPGSALSVGDRIDNDVTPARSAGLHAVFLDRHDRAPDADVPRISVLTELLEMVEFAG